MLKLEYRFLVLAIFVVAGFILSGTVNANCKSGEQRVTNTGAVFTCDTSHTALGEAWRDPEGLIWGDAVKNEYGLIRQMVQSSEYLKQIGRPLPKGQIGAKEYCESIGARLPSEKEFTWLVEHMGGQPPAPWERYHPQVLPNLSGKRYAFWSSSIWTDDTWAYYLFWNGVVGIYPRHFPTQVRCVVGS